MNKTLIKNFAIDARVRLIQMAIDNAGLVGIAKDKIDSPIQKGSDFEIYKTLAGTEHTITGSEIKQRENLVKRIKKDGFENVMEAAAYTWFNRIIAIRYMEINDYLPSRVRVLSSETAGKKEPDIITQAPDNIDLNFTESEKQLVRDLKVKQKMDEAFQFLFIKQCNELNKHLPKLFEKTSGGELDYTELLFSLSFIQQDGVVSRLLEIPEEDFKDQVQIIGWMYQYYNTELKDDTFTKLKKNIKITKERIPAATQLFTPDWIVRYMVENSLGRLYAQSNTAQTEEQTAKLMGWKYYLPQAEQTEEVQKKLDEIRKEQMENGVFNLDAIKILDPCMGSGHILVYAFDVLIQMYKNAGYNERDAAQKIMQNNIFGLDIDDRAAQLTYFALMMKGRQYDRRFFERNIEPQIYAIQESNRIDRNLLQRNIDTEMMAGFDYLIDTFYDAKEYGSIIDVEKIDYDGILEGIENWKQNKEVTLEESAVENCMNNELLPLIFQAKVMSSKYDVVVTNPPYMGASGMDEHLSNFVKKNYENSKGDFSTVFMEKALKLTQEYSYMTMINIPVWMFISSYEKLRINLLSNNTLINMSHNGRGIFGSDFGSVAFVFKKCYVKNYNGTYARLFEQQGQVDSIEEKEEMFLSGKKRFNAQQENFVTIPKTPIAYWVGEQARAAFDRGTKLGLLFRVSEGIKTGDNDKFLRYWTEINSEKFSFAKCSNGVKWYPHHKGGDYRKWYGNLWWVINWENDGQEIKNNKNSGLQGKDIYFKPNAGWSKISAKDNPIRYYAGNVLFDSMAPSFFGQKNMMYVVGLLNTIVAYYFLHILNPTLALQVGDMKNMPIILPEEKPLFSTFNFQLSTVNSLVEKNISLSKSDWDSFETSWDFTKHPLLPTVDFKDAAANSIRISDIYSKWEGECSECFTKLKSNEEELNRIFIEIYGLQDELTPEVLDKDVTVRLADRTRDIKSFISYAVGCMFGRYSLYKEGLAYAGGNMDETYHDFWPDSCSFTPDADNVIPITDVEYFSDDIVTRFVEFVRQVYGEVTLEENLCFIAESLPNKGDTPKEVIRSYFLNDFYKDHCKTYQKRPIYWLFDSGKENGFKALIYMHRYDNQTPARVRTDYLHKLQKMYDAALVQCSQIAENPATAARDKAIALKRIAKITKQVEETKLYDQALGHISSQYNDIDLDDGVNVNYEKFQGVQVAREGQRAIKIDLLGKRG